MSRSNNEKTLNSPTKAGRLLAVFTALLLTGFIMGTRLASSADAPDFHKPTTIKTENPHTLTAPRWLKSRPVYMDIINTSDREDALTGASSPVAERVVLQYTHDYGEGVKTMRPLKNQEIILPPRSRVRLRPGGMHLMLRGLKRPLQLGMEIPIKLQFRETNPGYIRAIIQKQPD